MALKKYSLRALWLLALMMSLIKVTEHTWQGAQRNYQLLEPPPLSRLNSRMLNILTLGHRGLYDDFMTIWMVQILVDPNVGKNTAEDLQKAILKMTRHHPQIESIYLLSCFTLAIDFRRPDMCEAVLKDGMNAMDWSWRLPATLGFVYYHYLKDFAQASVYYGLTATKKGHPHFIGRFAAKLAAKSSLDMSEIGASLDAILPSDRMKNEVMNILQRQNNKNSLPANKEDGVSP